MFEREREHCDKVNCVLISSVFLSGAVIHCSLYTLLMATDRGVNVADLTT